MTYFHPFCDPFCAQVFHFIPSYLNPISSPLKSPRPLLLLHLVICEFRIEIPPHSSPQRIGEYPSPVRRKFGCLVLKHWGNGKTNTTILIMKNGNDLTKHFANWVLVCIQCIRVYNIYIYMYIHKYRHMCVYMCMYVCISIWALPK